MEYGSTASARPLFFLSAMQMERLQWGSVRVDNALWLKAVLEKQAAPPLLQPFQKINTEKFSDPSSHGQCTFCFKLIGAAGWLRRLVFLCVPNRLWRRSALELDKSEIQQFHCTLRWSRCCGSLTRQMWWEHVIDWDISFIVNLANSQACVVAAASHHPQTDQTPLVMLQIPQRHFQMPHGIRESFHMTAVEGKSEDQSHVDSSVRKWK